MTLPLSFRVLLFLCSTAAIVLMRSSSSLSGQNVCLSDARGTPHTVFPFVCVCCLHTVWCVGHVCEAPIACVAALSGASAATGVHLAGAHITRALTCIEMQDLCRIFLACSMAASAEHTTICCALSGVNGCQILAVSPASWLWPDPDWVAMSQTYMLLTGGGVSQQLHSSMQPHHHTRVNSQSSAHAACCRTRLFTWPMNDECDLPLGSTSRRRQSAICVAAPRVSQPPATATCPLHHLVRAGYACPYGHVLLLLLLLLQICRQCPSFVQLWWTHARPRAMASMRTDGLVIHPALHYWASWQHTTHLT
jgi:hypothetical protein